MGSMFLVLKTNHLDSNAAVLQLKEQRNNYKIHHEWYYCSDETPQTRGKHLHVQVNIYASDQAKSFELRKFTTELTQPSKHLFLFK